MADTAAAPAPSAVSPKKRASSKAKSKAAPSHPKTSDMVNAAIKNLKERGGSSLQAIKKYIAATYKVDVEKLAPFIRKYLKSGVSSGALLQTKGKGASGSFKLSGGKAEKKAVSSKPKTGVKKAKKPKSPKSKPAASKPAKKKPKQASKAKKAKSPKKEKKAKTPKKPKSPKPKKSAKPKKK